MVAMLSLPLAAAARAVPAAADTEVTPNSANELDCNGYSSAYSSIKVGMKALCTDVVYRSAYGSSRFYDNGHYVGHDEPSMKFISSAPGTGNHMTYEMQLARDPAGAPTTGQSGRTVSDYAELSPAPWFGLPICDLRSYPQNPCTPDSDKNTGTGLRTDAGSAFMELQFYPPGYEPFIDGPSCDASSYCVALTIDSLECSYNFASCNSKCIEPVNFAYLQTNGDPAGPPSPQKTDVSTFTPNAHTLRMHQGDWVEATIEDTTAGLETRVSDLTTHSTGFMVASAANGFMNTKMSSCNGVPFAFHPEYNSAAQPNQVPWAALQGGVLMEQELGHFEPCNSVKNPLPVNNVYPDGQAFQDPHVYQTCVGGLDANTGEGPCTSTGCQNGRTEGNKACTPSTGLCEKSDAQCIPEGPRPVDSNGTLQVFSWPVAGCQTNFFQNGDLDFDGSDYIADWPDGSPTHPTPFRYLGPYGPGGITYPIIQFETDLAASEQDCNTRTGNGCTAPPHGADFYPFWTLGENVPDLASTVVHNTDCSWLFGNNVPASSIRDFGRDSQYGKPAIHVFGGTLISTEQANPQPHGC